MSKKEQDNEEDFGFGTGFFVGAIIIGVIWAAVAFTGDEPGTVYITDEYLMGVDAEVKLSQLEDRIEALENPHIPDEDGYVHDLPCHFGEAAVLGHEKSGCYLESSIWPDSPSTTSSMR